MNKEEKKPPKYNMWQSTRYMVSLAWREKEKKVLVLGLLTAVLAVGQNLLSLYITPTILSAVENKVPAMQLVLTILIFTGLLMLTGAAASYIEMNILFGRIQVRMAIITALNRKMAATSYPNISSEQFKELSAKAREAISGNSQATEAIWTTLTELSKNVLGFVVYILLIMSLEPWLIAVTCVTALGGYFITKRLNEYGYRHREEVAEQEKKMWYYSGRAENQSAAKDIRLFNLIPWLKELYAKAMDCYTAFHRRANGVYIWGKIADTFLTFLRNGIAYAYLIYLTLEKGLSAPEFLLYFSAVGGFAGWVTGILGNMSTLHKQSLDISTVMECLEYPEPFELDGGKRLEARDREKCEIRLENVSFRYPGSEKDTLCGINLTLHPGEKLAVVGLNGAGKTTLIKLLCGFLDPTEGRVLFNGTDVREINRRDYYGLFSAVFQSFTVLACTVAANVAQSEDNIDMAKVRRCLEKADLCEKIDSLPKGAETLLNREVYEDAVLLSGGETQRLMLARALYKDAPVIVLDEPTAALDPLAEASLYRKYNDMTEGKSSVYISHRLASTRFCDRIILVDGGTIAEEGTHGELLALGGKYASLYEVQSKYYREGGDGCENEE